MIVFSDLRQALGNLRAQKTRTLLTALRKLETVAPIDSTVLISDETPGDAPVLPLRVLTPPLSSRRVDAVASRSPS